MRLDQPGADEMRATFTAEHSIDGAYPGDWADEITWLLHTHLLDMQALTHPVDRYARRWEGSLAFKRQMETVEIRTGAHVARISIGDFARVIEDAYYPEPRPVLDQVRADTEAATDALTIIHVAASDLMYNALPYAARLIIEALPEHFTAGAEPTPPFYPWETLSRVDCGGQPGTPEWAGAVLRLRVHAELDDALRTPGPAWLAVRRFTPPTSAFWHSTLTSNSDAQAA